MTATQIGKLAVRRSIEIDAPPERVWQELATAERFRLWYTPAGGVEMPCKHLEFEPRVGGKFETEGYHEWQNGKQTFAFTGRVLVFDPPRELTVEMRREGMHAAMLLTFMLTPLDGDRTKAEIIQHGFERFGDAASNLYNAFESGWDMVVPNALRNLVEKGNAAG
jgi:uncharacterized protein YndB with AHSA1/START domain